MNLKWHQVKKGHIYFEETKTDNARQVPISDELAELIDKLRAKPKRNVFNLKGERIGVNEGQGDCVFFA